MVFSCRSYNNLENKAEGESIMDLKEFASGFLLLGLFVICLFTFVFGLADNNTEIQNLDTSGIDLDYLETHLNSSKEDAEGYIKNFGSENPVVSLGSLILFSVVGVGKLVINSILITFNIVLGGISNVLGIPPIVTGIISAILMIGLIFAAWKLYHTGK